MKLFNSLRPRARYEAGEDRMDVSGTDIEIVEAELVRLSGQCDQKVQGNAAEVPAQPAQPG